MNTHIRTLSLTMITTIVLGASARLQEQRGSGVTPPSTLSQSASGPALVPLKVQVVVARYQGERKVSSLPYTLSVTANDRYSYNGLPVPSSLRTGAQVPVQTMSWPKDVPADAPVLRGPVVYKDIGTNIDCAASSLEDGRFRIQITISDTSVYAEGQSAAGTARLNDIPTFRSFSSNETLILRDGQTLQFTAATDKISGEVTRVDVTLTVVK